MQHLAYGTASGLRGFKDCVAKSQPAMILGAVEKDGWRAAERWCSADALRHHYGHALFNLRQLPGAQLPLSRYLDYCTSTEAANPFYLFHSGRLDFGNKGFSRSQRQLLEDFVTPSWFADDVYEWLEVQGGAMTYFLCGGQRTGSNLHVDPLGTCAWNALLCGHKRWCLFPPCPGSMSHDGYVALIGATEKYTSCTSPCTDWYEDIYPNVKVRAQELGMIEFVQHPGETIFVPEGWWHNVLNLDFTVAITRNHMLPAMVPDTLQKWSRGTSQLVEQGEMMLEQLQMLAPERRAACSLP